MTDMLPMQKLLDAAAKEYPSLTRDELTALIGLSIEARQEQVKNEMKRAKGKITGKAKGGNIEKQMELFQDGGLKDEGGTKDPVSGNDVPPGATQEEVRDDIPAQLSEGEFVFPADVVRYIGLEKLMRMRQEAKMGLKIMEDMGQMGNADEATIPDDIPFSVIDIQIAEGDDDDDEVEKRAEGGVIEAANGFAGTTTATNPLQTRQSSMTASPTGLKTAYTAPTVPTATAAPMGGFRYKSPIEAKQQATFKGLFGGDELTQGPDEYRTYVNDAGAEIQIPFKNGKILTGFSIPEGFKPKTEKVDTAKIQTAKTKTTKVEQESGDGGDEDPVGLGGARVTLGNDMDYAVKYGLDGSVSLANVENAKATGKANFGQLTPEAAALVKQQALGQIAQLAYGFKPQVAVAQELAKKFGVSIPGVSKVQSLIAGARDATKTLQGMSLGQVFDMGKTELDKSFVNRTGVDTKGVEGLTEKGMRDIQAEMQYGRGTEKFDEKRASRVARDAERARQEEEARQKAERDKQLAEIAERNRALAQEKQRREAQAAQRYRDMLERQRQQQESGSDSTAGGSQQQDVSDQASVADQQGGMFTAKGSLITRKRSKPKKMKRGGLASK